VKPISVALKGKGALLLSQRTAGIARSYGLSSAKMDLALQKFVAVLHHFRCSATFPVVSVVLGRNAQVIKRYQEKGMEFALHGYRHIDHCTLSREEQLAEMAAALHLFNRIGITAKGFRGPYLHANDDTLMILQEQGLAYDSSLALSWEVLQDCETEAYRRALDFYGALPASDYPSLPSLEGNLVRIPYSLPDDEALVHRLSPRNTEQMSEAWLAILCLSHERGEMFTLGLHPERIALCQESLVTILSQARQLVPAVWIARLDEIADWWKARNEAKVKVLDVSEGIHRITVAGPVGTTVLARGIQVEAPTAPWTDGYDLVERAPFTVRSASRPFIGLAPTVDPKLSRFVQQQGYIVETSTRSQDYGCYLDQTDFSVEDHRAVLTEIENTASALVRLARWPDGARSALAITGDIDALTFWDYGLRLLGQ
jgi:peptidoglycan/xylan/chitin deacetylase (PgdA/CDA1 family)